MALRVVRFPIGKGNNLTAVNQFLLEQDLRSTNIISVEISNKGKDNAEYIIFFEDTTSPFIILTVPGQGEVGVAPGSDVLAIFSEPVQNLVDADIEITNVTDSTTVSSALYTINNTGASFVQGQIVIEDSGGYQEVQKIYRVRYKTSIKDLNGNTMEEDFFLTFRVGSTGEILTFDGGNEAAFSNPSAGRFEVVVTPLAVSYSSLDTLIDLTLKGQDGVPLLGIDYHYEPLVAPPSSFRIVLEGTGVLPTGMSVDWKATKGLI